MKKIFSLLSLLLGGSGLFIAQAEDGFMGPATVLDPVSDTFMTVPQDVWVTWNNSPVSFTSPQTNGYGEEYAPVEVSLDDSSPLEVPSYIMYVEGDGVNFQDQWMLDIAFYENKEITSFEGDEILVSIPEGIVKNKSGDINPCQTIKFTRSELSGAPYFFDMTWTPDEGTKLNSNDAKIYIGFGGNKIEYLSGVINLLSFKTWADYSLTYGKEVTISASNELVIDISGFDPAEYEIQIPEAFVTVETPEETCLNASLWLDYFIVKESDTPVTPPEPQDVITEAKGVSRLYQKLSYGTFVLGNEMGQYTEEFPATVVWGDNNEVYVKDILSTVPCDTYVKGTLDGDYITFRTNQPIDYYPEEGYGINLGVLKSEIKGDEIFFNYDPSVETFGMIVGKDGSLTLDLPGEPFDGENVPQYVLGIYYSDDYSFLGYCDYSQYYEKTDYDLVTMPADAEVLPYVFVDEYNYASLVKVAFDDDALYIQGLNPMLPEGVIKAEIEGDKAYVAQNEFIGTYMDLFFLFTKVLYTNPDYDEEDYESNPFIMAPEDVTFLLNIDRESGTIYADTDDVFLSFQSGDDFSSLTYVLGKFTLVYQDSPEGTPSNPTGLEYQTQYADRQGFNDFWFILSNFSTEGKLLDTETLFYRIFLDGEPLIFAQEEILDLMNREVIAYENVPDEQIWMPYQFNNGNDIYKFSDNLFDIGIYVEGLTTIGVQSMYLYGNDVTYSDVVTLNIETGEVTESGAGVETVTVSPVIMTEYYDLSGRKVRNPERGIFILRSIHEDGSVSVRKIAK